MVGSAEYMAPERLRDQPAGPASDLFSLGVTLCFLASGQTPFARGDLTATAFAVAFEPPSAHVPGPLGDVIEQLLDKDPAMRPSGAHLADALRAIVDGAPRAAQATLRQPVPPAREPAPHGYGDDRRGGAPHRSGRHVIGRTAPSPGSRRRIHWPRPVARSPRAPTPSPSSRP
ncbi:protein kinase domain-containing protein [Streptomyces sp. TRM 70351]|uniref:protein kinase domain-containing protein n=1 Tax=Streptomyces sp. TRM 70351 TaxID=3116552 RepID=UPI003FCD7A40